MNRIFVNAKPETAWQAARHFDGASIPWVRLLFDIRDISDWIRGKKPSPEDRRLGVDQVAESSEGFKILFENPGKEVVVGAIGKVWHPDIQFKDVPAQYFRDFDEPGWAKVVWAISVEQYMDGTTIAFELRTTATDEESWKKLNMYYHIISAGSQLIRHSIMSHIEAALGKMTFAGDDQIEYAGDKIIPEAKHRISFHKNIEAPPSMVWRYLMQLGCDRAGWYSIDALDHGGQPSIDHIKPEWTDRRTGDQLAATPAQNSFYTVYLIEPEKHFVIGGETNRMGGPFKMTWAFVLIPVGSDATHLVSNARMVAAPEWAEWFMGNILYPPIHGLMSSVQLRNIKHHVERDAQAR